VHFCARRQVPSADLVTQVGSRDCKVDTSVTKPRVNPTLSEMGEKLLSNAPEGLVCFLPSLTYEQKWLETAFEQYI